MKRMQIVLTHERRPEPRSSEAVCSATIGTTTRVFDTPTDAIEWVRLEVSRWFEESHRQPGR